MFFVKQVSDKLRGLETKFGGINRLFSLLLNSLFPHWRIWRVLFFLFQFQLGLQDFSSQLDSLPVSFPEQFFALLISGSPFRCLFFFFTPAWKFLIAFFRFCCSPKNNLRLLDTMTRLNPRPADEQNGLTGFLSIVSWSCGCVRGETVKPEGMETSCSAIKKSEEITKIRVICKDFATVVKSPERDD